MAGRLSGLAAGGRRDYVRGAFHHAGMLGAELVCSDQACAVVVEAVGDLAELELLVCEDCGCTLQVTAVWEAREARLGPRRAERLALAA